VFEISLTNVVGHSVEQSGNGKEGADRIGSELPAPLDCPKAARIGYCAACSITSLPPHLATRRSKASRPATPTRAAAWRWRFAVAPPGEDFVVHIRGRATAGDESPPTHRIRTGLIPKAIVWAAMVPLVPSSSS
jgi:hypothetical protein